jgi:ribonuclease BN (tRNA processing enzyme)
MSDDNKQQGQNQLNIELPEEIAEGVYSNLAIISHSHSEFVLDFIRLMPNVPKAKVKSRVVLTPQHAKRLLKALVDNVKKFESQHGPIQDQPDNPPFPPMNFNTPKAQA